MLCHICATDADLTGNLCEICRSPEFSSKLEKLVHTTIEQLEGSAAPDADLLFTLGNFYRMAGRLDEAIQTYKRALDKSPKPAYHHASGTVFAAKGDYAHALEHFEIAAKKVPQYADFRNDYGAALFKNERYDEAIAEFKEATKINPKYANAFNNLSTVYRKKEMHKDAETALDQAIKLDKTHAVAEYELGRSFYAGGMFSGKGKPMELDAKIIGDIYFLQENLKEALPYYQKAVKIHPEYADYHFALARAEQSCGDKASAQKSLEAALKINPKYEQAKQALKDLDA